MDKLFNIGELRHRITIQELKLKPDEQGGRVESWCDVATVWSKLEPTKSQERYFTNQIQTQRTHKIIIRWLKNITTDMRIKFGDRVFQIHGIRLPDERRFLMILDCEENQGT